MKKLFVFLFILIHGILYSQTVNISPLHNGDPYGGLILVDIPGYSVNEFCYNWWGPNNYSSTSGNQFNLDFGTYCVTITDCLGVLDEMDGEVCEEGEGETTVTSCVNIVGTTCEGFLGEMAFSSEIVCEYDDGITLFAPPIYPSCIVAPIYEWTSNNTVVGSNSNSVQNLVPGTYCVNISNASGEFGCTDCEGTFCIDVPSIDDGELDVSIDVQNAYTCKVVWNHPEFGPFEWWVFIPGQISVTINNFNPTVGYSGTVTQGFTPGTNWWNRPQQTTNINMTPGASGSLNGSNASISNNGYGSFTVNSGWLMWGDEFCFEFQDECSNVFYECVEIETIRLDKLCSEVTIDDIRQDFTGIEIEDVYKSVRANANGGLVNSKNIGNWVLQNDRDLSDETNATHEIYNLEINKYYNIIPLETSSDFGEFSIQADQFGISNQISIYPNPSSNQINLNFNSNESNISNVIVTNIHGQEVKIFKLEMRKGFNSSVLNLESLDSGTYILNVDGFSPKKFIIIK